MTPYSPQNQLFSDEAHRCAQELIYPQLFQCKQANMTFETASVADGGRSAVLDGEMGIDKIINVQVATLRAPIVFTVQERYRRIENNRYTDLTITEFNNATGRAGELYKMAAGIFVYGFYDDRLCRFERWVAVDINKMLHGIVTGKLRYKRGTNPRSKQDFLGVEVADLFNTGCHLAGTNGHLWGIR